MTFHYSLHLAIWLFVGMMLVGSHLWNAGRIVLTQKK